MKVTHHANRRPDPCVTRALERFARPAGWACDVGAGDGRHTFLLALAGYRVRAFEQHADVAARLRATAAQFDLAVEVTTGDAVAAKLPDRYAFVCVTNLLHHLSRTNRARLISRLRTATVPGGLHVVTVFTDSLPTKGVRAPFETGELRAMYDDAGWKILAYREWHTRPLRFGGEVAISYPYASLIARRPDLAAAARRRSAAGIRKAAIAGGRRAVRKNAAP